MTGRKEYLLKNIKSPTQTGLSAICVDKESEAGFLSHWEPHPGCCPWSVKVLMGNPAGPRDQVAALSEAAHLLNLAECRARSIIYWPWDTCANLRQKDTDPTESKA